MSLAYWLCGILLLADAGATAEMTIAVFPTEQFEKSKLAKPLAAALASKLQRPGWKVIDGPATEKRKSFLKPVEAVIEGNDAKRALSLDADIYIVFEGRLARSREVRAYQLSLGAYETVTGRKMASEVVMSNPGPEDDLALAKEACDRVVPAVVSQLQDYLESDARTGLRYIVALYNPPKNADMKMAAVLRKRCRFVKTLRPDERQDFYIQCKASRKEIVEAIKTGIRKKLGGRKYTIYPSPRQLIVINFR